MSSLVDYSFYSTVFLGELTETAFNRAIIRAEAKLNSITNGNITSDVMADTDTALKVKYALCEMIDAVNEYMKTTTNGNIKQSETVGNHSVTYAVNVKTEDAFMKQLNDIAVEYLHGTGLLYKGLKCTHIL